MFERFTDRARRVLVLAQEEARLLAHPFIGPEHVLLGLLAENEGVAAKALTSAGIDLERTRDGVGELEGPASTLPGGSPPFTPGAKKVLEGSLRSALAKGHSYIGTEHLLLALLDQEDGVAVSVLESLHADRHDLRVRVENLMAGRPPDDPDDAEERRQTRIHVLEGILLGMDKFADVIVVVQGCADRPSSLRVLMGAPFELTEIQASHVLDLTVASVTQEHRQRLSDELRALQREE